MRLRNLARAATPALLVGLTFASLGFTNEAAEVDKSDNIELVRTLEYANRYGTGANQGTDLEFTTITLDDAVVEREGLTAEDDADGGTPGVQRQYSLAGSYDNGLQIVDITDPTSAEIVAVYDCGISQGDVQIFDRDGRTYATFTHDTGYDVKTMSDCVLDARALGFNQAGVNEGTYIADVSDPYEPRTVSFVEFDKGSHNQTVHPSGNYLYNSNSDLITSVAGTVAIEVADISDLANPQQVANLELPIRPGLGTESHDITFNTEGTRAYSAALSQTVIINTEDPANPSVVSSFVDPAINVEHQSNPITIEDPILGEREFLLVEDEVAGATGTAQCPNGGVHVYDITGDLENNPVKVGMWNITDVDAFVGEDEDGMPEARRYSCTAHVFQLHEEEQLMTIAYYHGGVRVVDLTGLVGVALGEQGVVGMKQIAHYRDDTINTWAVKAPSVDRDGTFHMYGNDIDNGLMVYEVDLSVEAGASQLTGTWFSPADAFQWMHDGRMVDLDTYEMNCLLGNYGSGQAQTSAL